MSRTQRTQLPVQERFFALHTADGFALGATEFVPSGPAEGHVVVLGATAVPAGYYSRFATFLARMGLHVLTFDYRGVGLSRPASLRGLAGDMKDWAMLDARAAIDHVRGADGEALFAIIGHSFGGQALGLLDEAAEARAAVLFGSQLGYFGHWDDVVSRMRLRLMWSAVVPALARSFGYLPGWVGLGEDLPAGVARQWARWCSHPEYLLSELPEARERFARFEVPTLFYTASDDDYAPPRAVEALLEKLPRERVHLRSLHPSDLGAPIGHFGFFRPRFASSLWQETHRFLSDAFAGRVPEPTPWRGPAEDFVAFREEDILADLAYGRP